MTLSVRETLHDAGCSGQRARMIEQLYQAGQWQDALRQMRLLRCDLLEEVHQGQRKIDCLDFLIQKTRSEMKKEERER
ncbi:MAG: hypothetical protein IKS32_10150 [Solobacterium sp.]|nr:hypothetical protein [Solobacterium sp.]